VGQTFKIFASEERYYCRIIYLCQVSQFGTQCTQEKLLNNKTLRTIALVFPSWVFLGKIVQK